jgi:hypothetical protein
LQLVARWPACNYFDSYFSHEGRRFSGRKKRISRWEKKQKKHLKESEREECCGGGTNSISLLQRHCNKKDTETGIRVSLLIAK